MLALDVDPKHNGYESLEKLELKMANYRKHVLISLALVAYILSTSNRKAMTSETR